ncbi:hypothetical protein [Gilvibacter sp.]|uniref:hypothetical protein n=1 Tax=Gilvibacter sp. TaxID=2729997 RepID=UPI003F4A2B0F
MKTLIKRFSLVVLVAFLSPQVGTAQVGINTLSPNASLDIPASSLTTPSNQDGILIPRIDEFPATDPTLAQDGMLIFATGNGSVSRGFYYWNQAGTNWVNIGGNGSDADWLELPSNSPADDIADNIYTLGNVNIGQAAVAPAPLNIYAGNNDNTIRVVFDGTDNAAKVGARIINSNTGTGAKVGYDITYGGSGNGQKVGFRSTVAGGTTNGSPLYGALHTVVGVGPGARYGSYNTISSSGTGDHYGTYNRLISTDSSPKYGVYNQLSSGTGIRYGAYNAISGGSANNFGTYNTLNLGTGDKYGSYNFINSTSDGTHYGLYSEVTKAGSYAGYFLGQVSIGTSTTNNYLLPASRGTVGQIMQTDGSGNITWQNLSALDDDSINNLSDGSSDGNSVFLGVDAGLSDDGTSNQNIGIGQSALRNNSGGVNNVGIGHGALRANSSSNNTAVGSEALSNTSTGTNNVALGSSVMITNETGSDNVAIGYQALYSNTSGSTSIAIGSQALRNDLSGGSVAIGYNALFSNTLGSSNLSIGSNALYNNTTGDANAAFGTRALFANTMGSNNIALGSSVLDANTTGNGNVGIGSTSLTDLTSGDNNTAIGTNSLNDLSSGSNNTVVGFGALESATTTSNNTAIGSAAMQTGSGGANTAVGVNALRRVSGSGNTSIGTNSGLNVLSGTSNTLVGTLSAASLDSGTSNTIIGEGAAPGLTTGGLNIIIGQGAGSSGNSRGFRNTLIGTQSATSLTTTSSGNVFIGFQAGALETGSDQLYIDNSNTSDPLIHGDFNTNRIRFNGFVNINGAYNIPNTDGAANQVLTTNGSGTVSWADNDNSWSRTGSVLNLSNPGDDITFTNDQTSISFPASAGTPAPMLYMFSGGTTNSNKMLAAHSTAFDDWGIQYSDVDDSFRFLSGGTTVVEVDLFIGAGDSAMTVNGDISVNGDVITDTTTYPDYVFESYFNGNSEIKPEYSFQELAAVAAYIEANGHLPNVKSYDEIAAAGMKIDLAETAMTNLEKIEEAYLYLIELKKENEELSEQLNQQSALIDQLTERLERIEAKQK